MVLDSEAKNGNGALRRWTDKLLCAFALLILGLVSVVWANVCDEMDQFDAIQRSNVERIVKLEQHQADIKESLQAIRIGQSATQETMNKILFEMKK